MIAHYTAVADSSPIPVILYSVPVYTGIDLTPKAIEILAGHPNIIGMKDSGGDVTRLASLVHNTKHHNFKMLVGSASILLPGYMAGRTTSTIYSLTYLYIWILYLIQNSDENLCI